MRCFQPRSPASHTENRQRQANQLASTGLRKPLLSDRVRYGGPPSYACWDRHGQGSLSDNLCTVLLATPRSQSPIDLRLLRTNGKPTLVRRRFGKQENGGDTGPLAFVVDSFGMFRRSGDQQTCLLHELPKFRHRPPGPFIFPHRSAAGIASTHDTGTAASSGREETARSHV